MEISATMVHWMLLCCLCVVEISSDPVSPVHVNQSFGVLQLLRRLGESRSGSLEVSQSRNKNGESPIYYIKLPPTPYFYMPNVVLPSGVPHEKVPVEFTNNGRPNQVYHWNLPDMKSHFYQSSSSPAHIPASYPHVFSPAGLPATIPIASPAEFPVLAANAHLQVTPDVASYQPRYDTPSTSESLQFMQPSNLAGLVERQKWQTLKKHYAYNGKPSGLYIFKSKKPVYLEKHRRPLGKLLKW